MRHDATNTRATLEKMLPSGGTYTYTLVPTRNTTKATAMSAVGMAKPRPQLTLTWTYSTTVSARNVAIVATA